MSGAGIQTWTYPNKLPYCSSEQNHAVAIIGWDDNPPEGGNGGCWIVRNTFGPDWGEGGYVRIRYFSSHINCFAAFLEAESPDDGTLKIFGKVTVTGDAVSNAATVTLSGDDSFETVAYTDYGFPTLNPGKYRVTPYQPGVLFTPLYQDVDLTSGISATEINFSGVRLDV